MAGKADPENYPGCQWTQEGWCCRGGHTDSHTSTWKVAKRAQEWGTGERSLSCTPSSAATPRWACMDMGGTAETTAIVGHCEESWITFGENPPSGGRSLSEGRPGHGGLLSCPLAAAGESDQGLGTSLV